MLLGRLACGDRVIVGCVASGLSCGRIVFDVGLGTAVHNVVHAKGVSCVSVRQFSVAFLWRLRTVCVFVRFELISGALELWWGARGYVLYCKN